jgi:regulator of protease activity HflC (stomatin/prohibitin superfamily)
MSRYVNRDGRGNETLNVPLAIRDGIFGLLGLFVILNLVFGSWFIIDQTEMGNVRRFGTRLYDQPLTPGLHFKIPFIDKVDTIRVTLNTVHIDPFQVSTVDNQVVTVTLNYNYTIPRNEVNHLLYEVGGMGDDQANIHNQAIAVAKDRVSAIFAGQNMVNVNANRALIQDQISTAVHQRLQQLFGIEPHSLQIPMIQPSPAFLQSNEAAVKAKNDAVAAENTKRTVQFQADQQVIRATGAANSVKAQADGDAYAVKVKADAEQYRQIAESKGSAARIAAFGSAAMYNDFIRAQQWKGDVPTYVGAGAPIPFVNMGVK